MAILVRDILLEFSDLLNLAKGDPERTVSALKDPHNASKDDMIFVFTPKHLGDAEKSRAQTWIVHKDLVSQAHAETILTSPNPQLAMARIAKKFFPQNAHHQPIKGPSLHPSAQISPLARLGENCIVGPGAIVSDGCELGDSCIIGANAVLEPNVKVGPRTHIYPLVFIGLGCEVGADCEIHPHTTIGTEGFGYAYDSTFSAERLTHYGRVILEDRVHIGAGVQIDRGTFLDSRIGQDTKIDNHSHFAHNIVIGKNTIIAGGMIAAGSVTIGNYCVFGGRTTVSGHLEIADRTKVSGLSGISKSIEKSGEYGGFPLEEVSAALKTRAVMRHLPEMRKQIRQIMKHLGLNSSDN